jgi:hypothetical protein
VSQQPNVITVGALVGVEGSRLGEPSNRIQHGGDNDPERLQVTARLFAETAAGERLVAERDSMGIGLWRNARSAIWKRYVGPPPLPEDPVIHEKFLDEYRLRRRDIEDAVNQLLGRDPEQHRPPRLSWGLLVELLDRHGLQLTEDALIGLPFSFEFSAELVAQLAPDAP